MVITDSVDIEIWDKGGLFSIKDSRLLSTDEIVESKEMQKLLFTSLHDKLLTAFDMRHKIAQMRVYEGVIHGDREKLQDLISSDIGSKVYLVPRK